MSRARTDLAALLAILSLQAGVASAASCPAGTTEVARQTIGGNLHLWCVDDANVTEYRKGAARLGEIDARLPAIDRELETLDATLANEKAKLGKVKVDLGAIEHDCDAWVGLASEARKKQNDAALSALATVLLARVDQIGQEKEIASKKELDELYDQYLSSPLMTLAQRNARAAGSVAPLHRWQNTKEFLSDLKKLTSMVSALDSATSGEYLRTLAKLAAFALKDPRAKILVAETDFALSAVYANTATWTAKARIEQLLDESEAGLKGVESFAAIYREHVDRRKALSGEKRALEEERPQVEARQKELRGDDE